MSCASPSNHRPASLDGKRRWQRAAMGTFRLGVLLAAFVCLHALPEKAHAPDRERILAESRKQLAAVASLSEAGDGLFSLLGRDGENLGWATTTYPEAKKIEGYSGPSELLVIFDPARKVHSVSLLHSADTAGHVAKVQEDRAFWNQWNGRPEAGLGAASRPRIVTGASLTSEAMARGIAARFGAAGMEQWFPRELTTAELTRWFPNVTRIEPLPESGVYRIWGGTAKLGTVLRSSRMGVSARGFNGTSDVIVCLDPAATSILGVGLLGSRDNQPYAGDVADELKFADGFAGLKTADLSKAAPPLIVSGASVTADAVTTSVLEMLRRHQTARAAAGFPWKQSVALSWIALGVIVGMVKWGNRPRVRFAFAIISVAAGITLGWMLSQDQLIGWSRNGFNARVVLPLLVLTVVALVIPAYTGKNIYCNRLCPHGAAQTLLGHVVKKRFALPPKLHHLLRRVPWVTLLAIWAIAFSPLVFPFSHIEPFESWSSGFQSLVPAVIFSAGLLAAVFLPQGYCHYGCPTGALLKFLTHAPGRWTGKDTAALVLVALAGGFVLTR